MNRKAQNEAPPLAQQPTVKVYGLINSAKALVPLPLVRSHNHDVSDTLLTRFRYGVEREENGSFTFADSVPIANIISIRPEIALNGSENDNYIFHIHFLQVRTCYLFTMYCVDCSQELARVKFETKPPSPFSVVETDLFNRVKGQKSRFCVFTDTEFTQSFVEECPFDRLITSVNLSNFYADDSSKNDSENCRREIRQFFSRIYEASLFTLPVSGPPLNNQFSLVCLPSPLKRFCLDLRETSKRSWDHNKRMRKYMHNFHLSVNHDFPQSLKELFRSKPMQGQGEWATDWLYDTLVEMAKHREHEHENPPVKHRVFELWEGERLVAVTAGFAVGSCYHDYSMATLVKDNRSCGHILTKIVGHMLQLCGYSLWYWGYETEYMKTYERYGGREFDCIEFAKRWFSAREEIPTKSIEHEISCGNALIPPRK